MSYTGKIIQSGMPEPNKAKFNFKKTILVVLVKLTLTVFAFYIISKKITINPTDYLTKSNINYFLLAFFFAFSIIAIQAWRWKRILKIFSARLSFRRSFIAILFGHLINHLIPTASAGDLLRSYTLRYTNKKEKWKWLGAFFLEKYCAATSALLIVCASFLSPISNQLPVLLMGFIAALFLLLIMAPIVGGKIFSLLRLPRLGIDILLMNMFTCKNGRYAFLASVLVNLGMCLIFYTISLGLGIHLQFSQCLFAVPTFTLLAALPISFAGWGIRELSCVGLLGFFGVSSENAVVVSVMYGLLFFFSSLPGILAAYPFISSMRKLSRAEVVS